MFTKNVQLNLKDGVRTYVQPYGYLKRGRSEHIIHEQFPRFERQEKFPLCWTDSSLCIVFNNNNNNNSFIVRLCHFTGCKYHETTQLTGTQASPYVQFVGQSVHSSDLDPPTRNIVSSACAILKLDHSSLFFLKF